ncbi:CaiB/BaiF CoA transferase family protein [Devosia ginsengisoli]|uniref:CoA transferase n=1 Tax=Devosia ginsengisoli TaxID=400770 RepID=A0A5B8LRA0_9HYPH|nr:CoA transferase [Devosia ginsengisoli]QDZ10225.1 CoA transferase [Devosia ginsengisoli]
MQGPLTGIKVVDLTQIYNGPYATFLMAMAGAEVIKIEPPGGEHTRRRQRDGGGAHIPHAMLNSGKHFVVLDLKQEEGKAALTRLIEQSDVLVENYRPGVMARLGFSREHVKKLNPRLIYASSSGFGTTGPYRDYPAMDLAVQAMSGVLSVTGYPDNPPVKAGPAIADFNAGVHLYGAIATALLDRERTGTVRAVEVAMFEAIYPALASNLGLMGGINKDRSPRTGNRHGGLSISPYNVYECKDGHCAILANNEHQWHALARYFGQEWAITDSRYASMYERVKRIEEVDELVGGWAREQTKDQLFAGLIAVGVPCSPVRELSEVMRDEHLHARNALVEIEHPIYGAMTVPTSPLVFEGVPRDIRWPSRKLGEDQALIDQPERALGRSES